MEFSQKLADLRRREGFSQEQLADRLGVTRQSVSKWEGGAAMPDIGKLISLSELFDVSVDYLVKDYLEEPTREPRWTNPGTPFGGEGRRSDPVRPGNRSMPMTARPGSWESRWFPFGLGFPGTSDFPGKM